MPRGCFGTCGCLAGTARAVVDSPLGCCCCCGKKNRAHQRRFLEYFSRFHQVNHLAPTPVDNNNNSNVTTTTTTNNMRRVSSPRVHCNRPNLRLLVCSANLGNEQPNAESIAKWIPPDGFFVEDALDEGYNHIMENDDEDDELEGSERSLRPYKTKYPLRRHSTSNTNSDKDLEELDEMIMMDSLSKQLDLIVIGLQEATFDPPKSDSISDSGVIRIRVPKAPKTLKKLQTLRAAKDFASERNAPEFYKTSSSLSSSNNTTDVTSTARDMIATGLHTILQDEWEDGTHALHSLFEGRLPSYTRLVSYQRGQMRLIVFGRTRTVDPTLDPVLPLQVLHTAAQNTGRAGLANKGGIVTEILVNGCTRLSFISCHLEAHEGASKYAIRCQTLADILHGTAPRKKQASSAEREEDDNLTDSAHVVSPSLHSAHPSSHMALDVSMTSHYSFVLGDLNFRTDLSLSLDQSLAENEEAHKRSVFNMVEAQDWDGLNSADELHRALWNKDCLVGFQTLQCNFPPTFKVERQAGYQYIEKRRPSYTDRVLFKTGHQLENGLRPLLYEPIDDFTTSDHKPVRLACSLNLNPPFRMRPRAVRHPSMRWNSASRGIQEDEEPRKRNFLPRFLRGPFNNQNDNDLSASSSTGEVADLSSGQGFGRTGDNLHLFVNNICVILNNGDGSSHGLSGPNPYLVLMTQPEEAIRLPSPKRARRFKRALRRLGIGKRSTTEHTKDGWPCTSTKTNCFVANWEEEEISCRVATHTPEGGALDLSGAILFLSVMNGSAEDTLLGTVCFNLVNLIKTSAGIKKKQSNERNNSGAISFQPSSQHRRVKRSIFGSIFAHSGKQSNEGGGSSRGSGIFGFARSNPSIDGDEEDPIASVDINEKLLKNGVEIGILTCTIEAWWMDDAAAIIVRTPEEDAKASPSENRRGVFGRTKEKQPPTPRAQHRSAIVGT